MEELFKVAYRDKQKLDKIESLKIQEREEQKTLVEFEKLIGRSFDFSMVKVFGRLIILSDRFHLQRDFSRYRWRDDEVVWNVHCSDCTESMKKCIDAACIGEFVVNHKCKIGFWKNLFRRFF